MTLRDLIDQLQDLAEEHGEDVDVRLAFQPRWALEFSIGEVAAVEATRREPACVYIGEGSGLGYLSGQASVALGWREPDDDEEDEDEEPPAKPDFDTRDREGGDEPPVVSLGLAEFQARLQAQVEALKPEFEKLAQQMADERREIKTQDREGHDDDAAS